MFKDLSNSDEHSNKSQHEIITPYKVGVLLLIKEYCLNIPKAINERRDFCIVALKIIQAPDMDISSLLTMLNNPDYVLQRFSRNLEIECNHLLKTGIEGLLELFDALTRLIKPSQEHPLSSSHSLCRSSVLGLYVRRLIVFFEQLSFSEVAQLYDAFVKNYKKQTNNNDINTTTTRLSKSLYNNNNNNNKFQQTNIWDARQAELLVAQQAHALQTDEHKAMPPGELQKLVRELLRSNPHYAEAHYLSYLNCLRVNEYCGAIDSLYHCFDRLAPLDNLTHIDDRTKTFRYAALNLASLHGQFNNNDVAKNALKEAIMMAQEAGDNICLQLANAWMYHLSDDNKGQLIERSVGKANSLGITHTTSLSLISSAHDYSMKGKNPIYIFQMLVKSDVLNCQHSMMDLMSMSYMEKSALWSYYGKFEMSILNSQLLLLHNCGDKKQYMFNGTSTCQAVVNLANAFVQLGEYKIVDVIFNHAKNRFPNEPSNKIWMLHKQLYEFTKMMRHDRLIDAEFIANQISSLDPLESKFCLAEVSLAKGDYPNGLNYINDIELFKNLNPQNRVRSMILSSQMISSSVQPGDGTSGTKSIVLLNHALEICTKNYLSYYEAIVKMHLANIQLTIGMPNQALNVIDDAIINILSHGGWFDQARAFVLYAKCLIATAPKYGNKRKLIIQNSIKYLVKAQINYHKVEAFGRLKNTLYLLSIFYNEIDFKNERNQVAFEYRQLDQQYPTKTNAIMLY